MKDEKIAKIAVASILALGLGINAKEAAADSTPKMEKCYGIVKKGMNECAANNHPCEGQSPKDSDPNEWIYLPVGTCNKIVGGVLKQEAAKTGDNKDNKTVENKDSKPADNKENKPSETKDSKNDKGNKDNK